MGIYNLGGGGGAPELQAKEATPLITNAQQIILPDEGYDGLSKVTVNPMPTGTLKTPTVNSIGYVSSGVQTAGYFDTSATSGLQLSTQAAKTITPTTYSQTAVASGKYTTGAVTVAGDANLVSSNIVAGSSIFGVSGTTLGYWAVNEEAYRTTTRRIDFTMRNGAIPSGYQSYGFALSGQPNSEQGALSYASPKLFYIEESETNSTKREFIIQYFLQPASSYNYLTSNITFSWSSNVLTAELDSTSSMIFSSAKYFVTAMFVRRR